MWVDVWSWPQAIVWEEIGCERLVARYVMKLLLSEKADAPVALLAEVRQLEDRLGIGPLAMRKNYLLIDDKRSADGEVGADGEGATVTRLDAYRDLYGA